MSLLTSSGTSAMSQCQDPMSQFACLFPWQPDVFVPTSSHNEWRRTHGAHCEGLHQCHYFYGAPCDYEPIRAQKSVKNYSLYFILHLESFSMVRCSRTCPIFPWKFRVLLKNIQQPLSSISSPIHHAVSNWFIIELRYKLDSTANHYQIVMQLELEVLILHIHH